jgi:phosphoglycolate phosphatase-like HAD superfamily hydrolase
MVHVVLENVEHEVGDRLDDLAVGQAAGTGAREVRVGNFPR